MAKPDALGELTSDRDLLRSIGPSAVRKCPPEKLVGIIDDIATNGNSEAMRIKAATLIVQCYKIGAELLGNEDPDDDRDLDEMREEMKRLMARDSAARDVSDDGDLAESVP